MVVFRIQRIWLEANPAPWLCLSQVVRLKCLLDVVGEGEPSFDVVELKLDRAMETNGLQLKQELFNRLLPFHRSPPHPQLSGSPTSSSSSSAPSSPVSSPTIIANFSSSSSSSSLTKRSVGPQTNQYPIDPRTARPIHCHRMRSKRFSSSLFWGRGSLHQARKLEYGMRALRLYRSGGSTRADGAAISSTRRACKSSVGYDELRSDDSNVSGSGA